MVKGIKMNHKSLNECFLKSFLTHGNSTAISFLRDGKPDTELSYAVLHHDSNRIANSLKEMGVDKGDRVILLLNKSLIFVAVHIAIQKLGAVAVPLNPGFKRAELDYLIGDCKAGLAITEPEKAETVKAIDSTQDLLILDSLRSYQQQDFFRSASDAEPSVKLTIGQI